MKKNSVVGAGRTLKTLASILLFHLVAAVAWAQNRAVDTDGAIDLAGAVVVPSKLAVLFLFLAMVLLSTVGALLAQRSQERREARETRERLEAQLAAQQEEIERLRSRAAER